MLQIIQKKRKLVLTTLGGSILLVLFMLVLTPVLKKDNETFKEDNHLYQESLEEKDQMDSIADETNSKKEDTFIHMGVNSLVDGVGAVVEGDNIVIKEGGNYTVSGTLFNGKLVVDCTDAVYLTLENAIFRNANVVLQQAEDIKVNLVGGTVFLGTSDAFANNVDFTFLGNGSVLILSNFVPSLENPILEAFLLSEDLSLNDVLIVEDVYGRELQRVLSDNVYNTVTYGSLLKGDNNIKLYKMVDGNKYEIVVK